MFSISDGRDSETMKGIPSFQEWAGMGGFLLVVCMGLGFVGCSSTSNHVLAESTDSPTQKHVLVIEQPGPEPMKVNSEEENEVGKYSENSTPVEPLQQREEDSNLSPESEESDFSSPSNPGILSEDTSTQPKLQEPQSVASRPLEEEIFQHLSFDSRLYLSKEGMLLGDFSVHNHSQVLVSDMVLQCEEFNTNQELLKTSKQKLGEGQSIAPDDYRIFEQVEFGYADDSFETVNCRTHSVQVEGQTVMAPLEGP